MDQPDTAAQRFPNGGYYPPAGQAPSQPGMSPLPDAQSAPPYQPPYQPPVMPAQQPMPDAQSAPPYQPPAMPAQQPVPDAQTAPPYQPSVMPGQQPMPGQPYGSQYAQQYGAPQQYGAAPPYGPGQPYQPYPSAPAKKKPIALYVIIGIVVVALVGFCVYWFVIRDTSGGGGQPSVTATAPTTDTPTVLPQDAAQEFMQALAMGDSATALGFLANVPDDTTFLTDAVLVASNDLAPISNISVTPPSSTDVTSVDVSYYIGDAQEYATFGVVFKDGGYLLTDAISTIDLSGYYQPDVGMALNGVSLDNAAVMGVNLFPGQYQVTVGNPLLALKSDTFDVTAPNTSTADGSDIVFSDTAHSKLASAVSSKLKGCLKQKKLKTDCGFGVNGSPSVRTSTINWTITSGSSDFSKTKFKLDDGLTSASATIKVSVKMTCRGTNGASYYINPITIKAVSVDFTDPDNIDVSFLY